MNESIEQDVHTSEDADEGAAARAELENAHENVESSLPASVSELEEVQSAARTERQKNGCNKCPS